MQQVQRTTASQPVTSLVKAGLWLGAKTGFTLALFYVQFFLLIISVGVVIGSTHSFSFEGVFIGFLVLAVAYCYGVLPAAALGALTGLIIGLLVRKIAKSPVEAKIIGVIVSLGLSSLPAIALGSANLALLLFYAVPCLVYVGSSGWLGWKLYQANYPVKRPIKLWKFNLLLVAVQLSSCLLAGLPILLALAAFTGLVLTRPDKVKSWLFAKLS